MRALRNVPIKRKLTIITMIISGVAITISWLVVACSDFIGQRDAMLADLTTTAAILGDNSTAALSFNDPDSAKQTLKSLATRPHIVGAAIYDKEGHVFAIYQNGSATQPFAAPSIQPDGNRIDRQFTSLFRSIQLGGERIGTVYLQSDMVEANDRLKYYALTFVVVMVVGIGTALLLSSRLQKTISEPISHLAAVVNRVAADKNYSVRAVKQGEDEMGHLIDGFNEMLQQIQQRDSSLEEVRGELERRVEERTLQLANSLSLLNATIESASDGILVHHFKHGTICQNTPYRRMWNMPDQLALTGAEEERITWAISQVKDRQHFIARMNYIKAHPESEAFDVIELQDGKVLERYIKPQCVDGQQVGVVVNFRDITARKQAELELQKAYQRLLETSRLAGMAEVATGVLHNVGNVLNSVNVSANLVSENIKGSKVAGLAKVATLLRDHQDRLSEFISNDAKGKHLPAYLAQLCEHLLVEQQTTIRELETLRNNIDHIKQIVSMQQSYSKVSGVKEVVNVVDLIEDTLQMNGGALQRHGIEVIRQFAAVPVINAEKHKILQILINLVRNAKYACSESGRADKRMSLRVDSSATHITIAVSDNGIGIAPENITRIFSHGFTTRKDGHGFGLHSGALAARELGGSLHAHSDGIGHGATFTLELPIDAVEEPECLTA